MSRAMSVGGDLIGKRPVSLVIHQAPREPAGLTEVRQPQHPTFALDASAHTGDPNFMMSLARGLQVIQALAARKRPSTISQLSTETGLSRAVVRRCLHTLTHLGCTGCDDHHH